MRDDFPAQGSKGFAFFQGESGAQISLMLRRQPGELFHHPATGLGEGEFGVFGGLMTAFNIAGAALVLWVMAYPGIAQDPGVLRALYYLTFSMGGVGFSVPMGLLILGITIPAAIMKLLPKWLVIGGFILGVIGELSALDLVTTKALCLIPLTRFPGFIWLIIAGFLLPHARSSLVKENAGQPIQ